ncbi:MAG: AAA family ATPase, partial [Clostridium sp.]
SNYVNFIAEIFETFLTDTKIHIHKINKETGEIKEDFFVTYKEKEYSLLSNSERIKVGLEIANMFNVLLNKQYPTVVDDSESILELPIINTQMIICRVEDTDNINIE